MKSSHILIENLHWRHFPGDKLLAVFYAPVLEQKPPFLPYFKTTARLKCGRLLINPGTKNYYQDCRESLTQIISRIGANYDGVLHYGYSQGATGALDQCLLDPRARAAFGMSPHFNLQKPFTRPQYDMDPEVRISADINLVNRLAASDIPVWLFMPARDVADWGQFEDAFRTNKTVHVLDENHHLPSVNKPDEVIQQWLTSGTLTLPSGVALLEGSKSKAPISGFAAYAAFISGADLSEEQLEEVFESGNCDAAYYAGRQLEAKGRIMEAIQFLVRALSGNTAIINRSDVLIPLGNCYAEQNFFELAMGCYRQALTENPDNERAFLCLRNATARIDVTRMRNIVRTWSYTR